MALRFLDSFTHYSAADMLKKWDYIPGSGLTFQATGGPFNDAYCEQDGPNWALVKTLDEQQTWIVGWYFRVDALPSGSDTVDLIHINHAFDQTQIKLKLKSGGAIQFCRYDAVIDVSGDVVSANTWYHIQLKVTISDSITADSCMVKLGAVAANPTTVLNLIAGTDVQFQAVSTADSINLPQTSGRTYDIAHVYILDGTGSNNNDFLGPCKVTAIRPNGNGYSSMFVGSDADSVNNYLLIDETLGNSDTDYVESNTTNDIDSYTFGNVTLTATDSGIFGVQRCVFAKGSANVQLLTRQSSTNYFGSTLALPASYEVVMDIVEQDPGSAANWTETTFNAAEFGTKIVA